MRILFTRRSKIIQAVLKEPVTHCAIRYDDYVIHSTYNGVRVEHVTEFIKHSKVVHEIKIRRDLHKLFLTLAKYCRANYDYGAMFYLGFYYLLRRIGLPLPKKNLWQGTGMFLCTEFITQYIDEKEDSMITPYGLYLRLKG